VQHIPEHLAFSYTFEASEIREGWNDIMIVNGSQKTGSRQERMDDTLNIVGVELAVGRRPARRATQGKAHTAPRKGKGKADDDNAR